MPYPEGNIIARNIIERPKFDSTLAFNPWEVVKPVGAANRSLIFSEGNVASRSWCADRYRLTCSDATVVGGHYRVPLPKDALTRGVKVSLDYGYVNPTPEKGLAKVYLIPTATLNRYDYTYQVYFDKDKAGSSAPLSYTPSAFSPIHSEVTVPALDPTKWLMFTRDGSRLESKDWTGAHLLIDVPPSSYLNAFAILQCRVDYADTMIEGYFDGDTPSDGKTGYSYTLSGLPSESVAKDLTKAPETPPTDPGPTDPEPSDPGPTDPGPSDPGPSDPGPTLPPTTDGGGTLDKDGNHYLAKRAVAFVNRPGDPELMGLANAQLPVVEAFIHGYTRGRGFQAFGVLPAEPGLQMVMVSAVARLLTNPEGLKQYQLGDYMERPAVLNGWTLAELAILNRYRKRTGTA